MTLTLVVQVVLVLFTLSLVVATAWGAWKDSHSDPDEFEEAE